MPEQPDRAHLLAIVGPTASGKSALAIEIAVELGAEIVSIDSTMVYRGMDIATDKPDVEQLAAVPHHMVDIVEPTETVSVARFQAEARQAIDDIAARGKVPLLVGGSGLYFRAVIDPLRFPGTDPAVRQRLVDEVSGAGVEAMYDRLRELDPEAAARIQPNNERRIVRALEAIEITGKPFSSFRTEWDTYRSLYPCSIAGLTFPLDELDRRIEARVDRQIERGLIDEVRKLLASGARESVTSLQGLGYAQMVEYLEDRMTLEAAVSTIKTKTRRYARRQLMWFRADPRVQWFESDPEGLARTLIDAASLKGGA